MYLKKQVNFFLLSKYLSETFKFQKKNLNIFIRNKGQITESMAHVYGNKTKHMAYIIATRNYPDSVNIKDIKLSSYIK